MERQSIPSDANTVCNLGTPLTLAPWPPKGAANNCGQYANLSDHRLVADPLTLAGVPLITAVLVAEGIARFNSWIRECDIFCDADIN